MTRAVLVLCACLAFATGAFAQDAPAPRVYPNPIAGQRVVTVETETARPARLEVFDVRGRVVPTDQPLSAGTYFVRIRFNNGSVSEPAPITLITGGRRQFNLVGPPAQTGLPGMSFSTAVAPEITTLPADSLGLGEVEVGSSAQDTVFVRNDGDADLTVSSAALSIGGAFLLVSGGSGGVVTPGDSLEVIVSFAPSSVGAQADTLTIASDDADEPSVEVELTGTGTAPSMPEIETSTDSLGFGMVVVGDLTRDTVVVRNIGTAALSVTSASLSGGTAFAIESGGGAASIAPGDSVQIALAFAPTTVGLLADTLTILSDDADEPSLEVELTGEGMPVPAPEIDISSDSLGVGDVLLGVSVQDTVVVRNVGTADLTLASLALGAGGDFAIVEGGSGGIVAAGDSVIVVISFTPSALGAQADTLIVTSDDADEPTVEVEITGTGVQPEIEVAADSLGFGDVVVGATREDSVVVRNRGGASLSLSSITLTDGTHFSIASGGDPTTIAPGDSATVMIAFAPGVLGALADTLTVASDDSDEPSVEVELTGTGVQPDITALPDSVGFGEVLVGATARDTVTVRNDGTSPLSIAAASLTGGTDFAIESGGDPSTIAPGDSVRIALAFAPLGAGAVADTLVIASDDPDESPLNVELTGVGISPDITALPDSLGFGSVDIGMSTQDTVTVRNDGTADLNISSITLASGAPLASAFSIAEGGDPVTLSPGDSVSVVISFAPMTEGPQADTLVVASDDLDEPTVQVELTGVGVGEPEVAVVPASLAFGTVQNGEQPRDTVVVRNEGTGTLTVSSVTLGGTSPEAYSIESGGGGGAIAPGDSLEIVVAFGPIYETEQLATLTIASDDADESTVVVPLSGTGLSPGYVMMYVLGDSQAAGKGDPDSSCAMRPDAIRRGWFYQRSTDTYVPVCSDEMPDDFKSTIMPALVDEVYERYQKIPLVVFYTEKGTPLTPEAVPGNTLYWYMGDRDTDPGEAFDNVRILLKKAKRTAQEDFASRITPVAGIHSFGGIDARKWFEEGDGHPDSTFRPRLAQYDAFLSRSNLTPLYFEIGRAPGRANFDIPLATFRDVLYDEVGPERIGQFDEYVFAQYTASGQGYDRAGWYADKHGHLGSLGLDYLGTQLAIALDL